MAPVGKRRQRNQTAVTVSTDLGVTSLMHDVLSKLGFDVVEVKHGEEVLEALRLETPELVVFDGNLPKIDVLEFLNRARPLLGARKVPVVLAREGAQPIDRAEGGDLVEVVINRPFNAVDLEEAVTIARWASDRSNDPRISGGARPSQMLTPLQRDNAPSLPTEPPRRTSTRSAATSSSIHVEPAQQATSAARDHNQGARPQDNASRATPQTSYSIRRRSALPRDTAVNLTPPSQMLRTSRAQRQSDDKPSQRAGEREHMSPRIVKDRQNWATTSPQPLSPTRDERTRPASPDAQRDSSRAEGLEDHETGQDVTAPSAKKRFKRTLAFVAGQQPTVMTEQEKPAPRQATRSRKSGRTHVDLPEDLRQRDNISQPHRRPSARSRRKGAQLQPGVLIADRYAVRDLLGTGGMAEVYRVHDRELDEEVALKLLKEDRSDAEIQARFRQEMRICRRLNHSAIVRTYEFGVWQSRRFITMEVLDGEDMARVLMRAKGPMTEEAVRTLFAQVCRGLDAAHDAGVIHRDVKPHNIFVLKGQTEARLMDFGIAKVQDLTTTAEAGLSIIGTPAYLPPERLEDGIAPGPRTDLYSVGASMYHAITGELPFGGKDISALLTAIVMGKLKPPQEHNPLISDGLQDLIMTAMARLPSDRPKDCATLADSLDALST